MSAPNPNPVPVLPVPVLPVPIYSTWTDAQILTLLENTSLPTPEANPAVPRIRREPPH